MRKNVQKVFILKYNLKNLQNLSAIFTPGPGPDLATQINADPDPRPASHPVWTALDR
jgi:hypothetical protein